MIRAILVDDEKTCLQSLQQTLGQLGQVEVVAACRTIDEAQKAFGAQKADLLFLDVELQDRSGFELLTGLGSRKVDVIFTTAHDQYALRAIKASALDYLMKPIGIEDLREAVNKHLVKKAGATDQLEILLQHYKGGHNAQTLAIPTLSDIEFIRISEIIRLHAEGNYTIFYLTGKRKFTVCRTLQDYEEVLSRMGFVRTHRSHIINLGYLKKYRRGEGGTAILQDGSEVEVSRQRKEEFLSALNNIH